MSETRREQNRINQQKYRDRLKAAGLTKFNDDKNKQTRKKKLIEEGEEFIKNIIF